MSKSKRPRYTLEFQIEAVRLVRAVISVEEGFHPGSQRQRDYD